MIFISKFGVHFARNGITTVQENILLKLEVKDIGGAHCVDGESPFHMGGYYIQVFTKDEIKGCDVKGELKGRKGKK